MSHRIALSIVCSTCATRIGVSCPVADEDAADSALQDQARREGWLELPRVQSRRRDPAWVCNACLDEIRPEREEQSSTAEVAA